MRAALVLSILVLGASTASAQTDPLSTAAIHAPAQYYLLALPPTPVDEVAETVLGEALGLPYEVDPDISAEMSLSLEGRLTPRELIRAFADRLDDNGIALIEKPSDGLWLVPESEVAALIAQGSRRIGAGSATVVAGGPGLGPASIRAAPDREASTAPRSWSWLAWLTAGWLGGVVSVLVVRRRKRPPEPLVALPSPVRKERDDDGDAGLVIPEFARGNAQGDATNTSLGS